MLRNGKKEERISARSEKWTRRFPDLRNTVWSSAQAVTAKGLLEGIPIGIEIHSYFGGRPSKTETTHCGRT